MSLSRLFQAVSFVVKPVHVVLIKWRCEMADEDSNSNSHLVIDDSLAGLVSGQIPPSSIDDISPDVECDQQMDDLFKLNAPKDIINGNPKLPPDAVVHNILAFLLKCKGIY